MQDGIGYACYFAGLLWRVPERWAFADVLECLVEK